jgi:RimJ/RimL family protein N-acetyltransferase
MKLRNATIEDWDILLEWRNDPTTRYFSFNQDTIDPDSHKQWLSKSLNNPSRKILILEDQNGEPVGSIRSDKNNNEEYVLSWVINPLHRKKGYGSLMLSSFLNKSKGKFIAEIKDDNIGSIKMVTKKGFSKIKNQTYIKINE